MLQTLFTVKDGTAVIIPANLLERYGLKAGDLVNLLSTEAGIAIVPETGLDPSFENALRTISRERHELFQRLADFDMQKP